MAPTLCFQVLAWSRFSVVETKTSIYIYSQKWLCQIQRKDFHSAIFCHLNSWTKQRVRVFGSCDYQGTSWLLRLLCSLPLVLYEAQIILFTLSPFYANFVLFFIETSPPQSEPMTMAFSKQIFALPGFTDILFSTLSPWLRSGFKCGSRES